MNENQSNTKEILYSYELVHGLSFFIISIELICCGYLLLNAEKFGIIKSYSYLFLLCGMAAIFGLFWRFCYNKAFSDYVHDNSNTWYFNIYFYLSRTSYWFFVALTILFFICSLSIGFKYLNKKGKVIIEVESKNNKKTEIISKGLSNIQDGLNNISKSIEKLSEVNPQIDVNIQMPEAKVEHKGVVLDKGQEFK